LEKINMSILLIIIHIIVCIALIMIVLLQTGKGADMGAAFGGGSSQTLFGSTGASTFLGKATTGAAIIFMVTSLGLAYLSSHRTGGQSVVTNTPAPVAAPAVPGTTTPPAAGSSEAQPANSAE
jgi:preprotein translocase subunit SecG